MAPAQGPGSAAHHCADASRCVAAGRGSSRSPIRFHPAQPRDEIGRWTDTGAGPSDGSIHLAASDKPTLGRHALFAILAETARKLIEAYRSENGLWNLFGRKTGAVTVTTSPTYQTIDRNEADAMRWRVADKYLLPSVSGNDGLMPANAFYHAETTVLLRAARVNGGSLAGRTLDVFGDTNLCNNC